VRYLAESEEALKQQYRGLRVFVIWVGGDEGKLTEWAKDNGVENLPMGVIDADDESLGQWRINKRVRSTTIVLDRRRPLANFVDWEPQQPQDAEEFEKTLADGLQHWRR
jgi:hypothetical protein